MKRSAPAGNGGFVLLITVTIAVGQLGVSLYLPAMPAIGDDLSVSPSWMAMTLAVYFAGFAFFTLLTGPFSDAFGRRFVMLRGLEVYAAGTFLCAVATDITLLLSGRFLQAFGASVAPAVGKAIVQDISREERTVVLMGWLGAAMSITPAVAPFIGGIIVQYLEWRWIFWLLLIFNVLIWSINLFVLSETLSTFPSRSMQLASLFKSYREFLGNRFYTGYVLLLGACFGGLGAFYTASPYVFIHGFRLSPFLYGVVTLIIVVGFIAGNLSMGFLTGSRWFHRTLSIGGFIMLAGALGMFFVLPQAFFVIATVVATTLIYALGFGVIYPMATKEALGCYVERAGAAAALLGFVQRGGSALCSAAVAFCISLSMSSYSAMVLVMFLCAVFAIIIIRCVQRGLQW
ncbi:MAG: multidrug effflux MFS transporter [Deltaproteobacteria bacterium]|nr:multidrug effflux MFS transporter [Deltaproteobacteria bacterium]